MKGILTCIILGAGASACYEDGEAKIPLQKNFFKTVLENGAPYNMYRSNGSLANYLSVKYNDPIGDVVKFLADKQIGIEDIYQIVEDDWNNNFLNQTEYDDIAKDLHSVTYLGVALPVSSRNNKERACRYHANLARSLEPGDIVISFNYDFLIDDALTWFSEHWNPMTGYGFLFDDYVGGISDQAVRYWAKRTPVQSGIHIFHPHGSIVFWYSEEMSGANLGLPFMRQVGMHHGIQMYTFGNAVYKKNGKEYTLYPLIIPPSPNKSYGIGYSAFIMSAIKAKMRNMKKIIVIGYSFPSSDNIAFSMFPNNLRAKKVQVVNLDNQSAEFRNRCRAIIKRPKIDFSRSDFKRFAMEL